MPLTVFYSWQSDRPKRVNRYFIEDALKRAVKQVTATAEVVNSARGPEVTLDKDTAGLPGTPPIVETIFNKIDQCAVFVPDLTFVASTASGRLTPNANVLIEYGWALKSRTHQRIVPVMNDAFGEPNETNLPFNMRHLRWPLCYTLPDSIEADRSEVRGKLTNDLVTAIRTVLERAPIGAASGPKFEATPPTYDKAVFFRPGETLARLQDRAFSLPQQGPLMFLRLIPTAPTEEISPMSARKMAMHGNLSPFGASNVVGGIFYDRNRFGALAIDVSQEGISEFTQVLKNRELWGISSRIRVLHYLPVCYELLFRHSLMLYIRFAREKLELPLPLLIKTGITGIEGLRIAAPPGELFANYERYGGRAVEHDVEFEVLITDWGISPEEVLSPFFEKVWDAFGLERSDFASWWGRYV